MNKRVAKPKRKLSLVPDDRITEAETDKYFRDHHAEVSEKLRAAMVEMEQGKGTPLKPLEKFLADARRRVKRGR